MSLPIEISSDHKQMIDECRALANAVEPFSIEADESSVMHAPTLDAFRSVAFRISWFQLLTAEGSMK